MSEPTEREWLEGIGERFEREHEENRPAGEQLCLMCEAGVKHGWCDDGVTFNGEVQDAPKQISEDHRTLAEVVMQEARARGLESVHVLRQGDPRFHALLKQIGELHDQKQSDYGRDQDPFANVRASEEWGVTPWVGALIRATDKIRRLQTYANKGSLVNEGVEDSLMDLAVYALISLILFRETRDEDA